MPSLNGKAKSFHKIVNLNEQGLQQSSALRNLTDKQVEATSHIPSENVQSLPQPSGRAPHQCCTRLPCKLQVFEK